MARVVPASSTPSPTPAPSTLARWGLAGALVVATLLTYLPALGAGFIWNDSEYVTAPGLRSTAGLARIWFELGATEQYYPILHSAFWLQHRLWGDAALGYHLLNVLLHAGAALLLLSVLRKLAVKGAELAAFIYALHPVYVESVAWISEQKNTLSLVFYLLAALAFLRFHGARRQRDNLIATALFVVALLSKSVTATLPAALLVALWWRHGRLEWRRDVRPLLPWFVLGAAMGLFSAWVEKNYIGADGSEFELTGLQRTLLAGRIVWFYVGKLLWPAELIFIYPRWTIDPTQPSQWIFLLAVIAALTGLWAVRKRWRAPLAAALFFGGSLFPTLGFFNVYAFIYSFVADHWQYLPSIGLVVLFSSGLVLVLERAPRAWRRAVPVGIVVALAMLSFQQSRMYADMRTFYATTLARNPECWMAHNNLGNLLNDGGEWDAARAHFEAALQVRPDLHKVHNNLGNVLRHQRRLPDAVARYERALALKPDYAEAHNNLAGALLQLGENERAMRHAFRAVQLDPEYTDARNNLGMALRALGRLPEAISQFEQLVRIAPDMAPARLNLALTLSLVGRMPEAMEHYREARRLNPAIPELPVR